MNQGTQGYRVKKKTEGQKSRETVSLRINELKGINKIFRENAPLN
jgi:hypothetical protein